VTSWGRRLTLSRLSRQTRLQESAHLVALAISPSRSPLIVPISMRQAAKRAQSGRRVAVSVEKNIANSAKRGAAASLSVRSQATSTTSSASAPGKVEVPGTSATRAPWFWGSRNLSSAPPVKMLYAVVSRAAESSPKLTVRPACGSRSRSNSAYFLRQKLLRAPRCSWFFQPALFGSLTGKSGHCR
jgi:hypothetical protein